LALVIQIVLGLVVLGGLVALFLSTKNWHWTQVTLVFFVFVSAIFAMWCAAKTLDTAQAVRSKIPGLEQQLAAALKQNEELRNGTRETPGILELAHQLHLKTRARGRVWRGAQPAAEPGAEGSIDVNLAAQPHGLDADTVVYAFETGPINAEGGRLYLGEFKVSESRPDGVTLQSIQLLDEEHRQRLATSRANWSLYETMPTDDHVHFAGLSEETMRQMLPEETVEEFLRQGTPATDDDDQWHRKGFDANDQVVGPDKIADAVRFEFDRPLRDYTFLFGELMRERVVNIAKISGLNEDLKMLAAAQQSAEALGRFREQQKQMVAADLATMITDRKAIEAYLALVQRALANAKALVESELANNSAQAQELTELQLGRLRDSSFAAPASAVFTNR
jgi:hypothetical protein